MIKNIDKWLSRLSFLGVVVILLIMLVGGNQSALGGSSDSGYNATADGVYAVDGTTVIDGSGNWVGTGTITG